MTARLYLRVNAARAERLLDRGWNLAAASTYGAGERTVLLVRDAPSDAPDDYAPTICAMASARADERLVCVELLEGAGLADAADLLRRQRRSHP